MPRRSAIPHIPIKAKMVQRRLTMEPELDATVQRFCDFYATEKGARPEEEVAIVALLRDALERNRAFMKFLRENSNSNASFAKSKAAGRASETGSNA